LDFAVNTVARGYAELAIEGVVISRAGGGSVIAPRGARTMATDDERLQVTRDVFGSTSELLP